MDLSIGKQTMSDYYYNEKTGCYEPIKKSPYGKVAPKKSRNKVFTAAEYEDERHSAFERYQKKEAEGINIAAHVEDTESVPSVTPESSAKQTTQIYRPKYGLFIFDRSKNKIDVFSKSVSPYAPLNRGTETKPTPKTYGPQSSPYSPQNKAKSEKKNALKPHQLIFLAAWIVFALVKSCNIE